MSCEQCTHCQKAKQDTQDAANAYEIGTELYHTDFGRVVFWRTDLGMIDIHYVYRAGDEDEELLAVSGANLTVV